MRFRESCLIALALWAVAGRAQAQTTVTKRTLTLEGAKAIAAAAVAEATKGNEGASIAVVDDGGNLMYLERLQPTFPMGATISTEKARTAALFQKPTKILEDAIVGGRTPLLNAWSAPLNGGEPIVVDGQVVGAMGVSGASSAARDAAIAIAGAAAVGTQDQREPVKEIAMRLSTLAARWRPWRPRRSATARAQSGDEAVRYLGHDEVAAAFAKGVPMIEVRDYKIHASRREGPGHGRGPYPRHRHRLRPAGIGDAGDRRHGRRPQGDRRRGAARHRHRGRRDSPARAGRCRRHPQRHAALVQGGDGPLPLLCGQGAAGGAATTTAGAM